MEETVLFEDTLKTASIKITQDGKGGVIWIQTTGNYPICPSELKEVLKRYKNKEV